MSAMGAVWLRLRAELRHQWRTWLALAVLLGVIGGIALTAAAGARRTDTAYPRFLRARATPRTCWSSCRRCPGSGGYFRAVGRLPQVSSSATTAFLQMSLPGPGASPFSDLTAEASPAGGEGISLDRVKVVAGRIFNPADPHAVMIDQQLADRAHVRPGGTLHLIGYPQRGDNPDVAHAARLAFRVSAIVVFERPDRGGHQGTLGTAAPVEPGLRPHPAGAVVQPRRRRRLRECSGPTPTPPRSPARRRPWPCGTGWGTSRSSTWPPSTRPTQRAIRPEAVALAIFAALAGLIALAIIGQLLSRQLVLDSAEFPVLRALGMPRSRLAALSLARVAVVTTAGAVARRGDRHRGVPADAHRPGPGRRAQPRRGGQPGHPRRRVRRRRRRAAAGGGARCATGGGPGPGRARAGRAGRARTPVPAGPGARAGRFGAGQPWGADGVRARPWTHRGAGAQRPGRDDGGGRSGGGSDGLRRQLPRAGRHAAPVRAELGPAAGPAGRVHTWAPWARKCWRRSRA